MSHPAISELADTIACARTLGDLQEARQRFKHTEGILDDERRVLETVVNERERELIRFYLPHENAFQ